MTKEEALKILRKDLLSNLVDYYSSEELQDAIDTIVSHPSLPSNLDEAAHEFEDKAMSDYDDIFVTKDGVEVPKLKYSFSDVFKAGAEWMAGQGVKAHCVESSNPASEKPNQRLHLITLLYEENENTPYVVAGDNVELTLRKKK